MCHCTPLVFTLIYCILGGCNDSIKYCIKIDEFIEFNKEPIPHDYKYYMNPIKITVIHKVISKIF